MGLRYLIAAMRDGQVHPAELNAIMAKAGLELVFQAFDCRVYLNISDRWAQFADRRGVVVGDLFEKADTAMATAITAGCVAERAHDLEELSRRYWGGYVAIRLSGRGLEVFRDPSGALPVYYIERRGGWYVASDAPLLSEAGLYAPQIDWSAVAWFYYTNGLPNKGTALIDVKQVIPGVMVPLWKGADGNRLLWSPWQHVSDIDRGPDVLRDATIGCVRAWQSRYGALVAGVSGGLDSSIVALGLGRNSPVTALTVSTGDAQGNEASYATALCESLGLPLIVRSYTQEAVDIARPSLPHRPLPGGMAQLQAYDAVVIDVAQQTCARAFMSGVGGDNVFQLTRSARPLVDRLLAGGLISGSFATLNDICRITGAGRLTVIREAMRVPRRPGPKYRWPVDPRFLETDVVVDFSQKSLRHPWLDAPRDCLPGKHAHVASIVRAHAYLECHDRRLAFASVHPLMSQPIIELSLATPSWVACEGGVDRSRARRAFANDLLPAILQRRLKGGPDGFALKLLRSQLSAIRERLLEGRLVREALIRRSDLEQALTESNLMRGRDYTRILQLLDTEAWAERWLSITHSIRIPPPA